MDFMRLLACYEKINMSLDTKRGFKHYLANTNLQIQDLEIKGECML